MKNKSFITAVISVVAVGFLSLVTFFAVMDSTDTVPASDSKSDVISDVAASKMPGSDTVALSLLCEASHNVKTPASSVKEGAVVIRYCNRNAWPLSFLPKIPAVFLPWRLVRLQPMPADRRQHGWLLLHS